MAAVMKAAGAEDVEFPTFAQGKADLDDALLAELAPGPVDVLREALGLR